MTLPLPGLPAVLANLRTGSYTVRRYPSGSYNSDGEFNEGSYSSLTVVAAVQPAQGEEVERFAQGDVVKDTVVIYSPVALYTNRPTTQPDRLEYKGALYEVVDVEDWSASGSFWKAYAQRADLAP